MSIPLFLSPLILYLDGKKVEEKEMLYMQVGIVVLCLQALSEFDTKGSSWVSS